MGTIRPPRLVRLSRTWNFENEADDISDCDDGEPRLSRASRRIGEQLRKWRDAHGPEEDPWFDESLAQFHVADVALLYSEVLRLWHLEDRVRTALGPPTVRMVWRKAKGKFEEE
jgi:hypothetical protein